MKTFKEYITEGKDVSKARKRVDKIYNDTKKKIDKKGYYENAGYEKQNDLEDFMSKLDMSYSEKADVITYFYQRMDAL